jgi:hypothetical protein
MTNERKPDGYCAWHPESGVDPLSFSRDELTAWHIRLGIDTDSSYMRERGFDHAAILAAKANGWQKRSMGAKAFSSCWR